MQLKLLNFKAFTTRESKNLASFHGLTGHISIFTREISTKMKNSLEIVVFLFDKGLLIEPYG